VLLSPRQFAALADVAAQAAKAQQDQATIHLLSPSLNTISLCHQHISKASAATLATRCGSLRQLSLQHCTLPDSAALTTLLKLSGLTALRLTDACVSRTLLFQFVHMPRLRVLAVTGAVVDCSCSQQADVLSGERDAQPRDVQAAGSKLCMEGSAHGVGGHPVAAMGGAGWQPSQLVALELAGCTGSDWALKVCQLP
jgi:hypothetical protein